MKDGYKYLVKLTNKDNETIFILTKSNDIDECKKLVEDTTEWINKSTLEGISSLKCEIQTAPENCVYC